MYFFKDENEHFFVQLDKEQSKTSLKLIEEKEHSGDSEKHLPLIQIEGQKVKVKVGDIMHPMTNEHHISLVYLKTKKGGQYQLLPLTSTPIVEFYLVDDEIESVYIYCNLHGLWKKDIK